VAYDQGMVPTRSLILPAAAIALIALLPRPARAGDPKFEFGKAKELEEVEETEWSATAEAGVVLTTGNSRTTNLTGSAKASRKEKRNKLSLEATGTFARASTLVAADDGDGVLTAAEVTREAKTSAQSLSGKVRYDRFLTELNSLFVAAVGATDRIAGKELVGGGQLGYARLLFKNKCHQVTGEAGYDLSYEAYASETQPSVAIHSARLFAGYEGTLTETTKLTGSVEVLVNLNGQGDTAAAFEDTRSNATAALSTQITDDIALSVSVTAKFDNVPAPLALSGFTLDPADPPLASRLDTTTKASLIVTLL